MSATVRIGSAQGYYGDDVLRSLPMLTGKYVDYICFEALSELTMAILRRDLQRDPARGYTRDIATIARQILPRAFAARVPLITNGGGLNPTAAAELVRVTAAELELHGLRIATVTGDDVLPRLADLIAAGHLRHIETGATLEVTGPPPVVAANAYLGAAPIVEALAGGADIVITGRVADPSLYLAPLIHRFGWAPDDWDRLAAGTICGHLLECTGQVVGGNTLLNLDRLAPGELAHLGYPIAEVEEDGSFIVTKTPDRPGFVTTDTVKEQLLYEMHDPAAYLTPDVTADITALRLEEVGTDRVRVSQVRGHPRPETLKANVIRLAGFSCELIFMLGWPRAWEKERQLRAMLTAAWDLLPLTRVAIDHPGIDSLFGSLVPPPEDPVELLVRVVASAKTPDVLQTATRRALALGLACPAGMSITGQSVGDDPRTLLSLWPATLARDQVTPSVSFMEVP